MEKQNKNKAIFIKVIYAGKRHSINEIFSQFYVIDVDNNITTSLSFTNLKKSFGIGCIYEIEQSSKTKYILSPDKFILKHPDKDLITEYSIAHNAAVQAEKSIKEHKRLITQNPTIEIICKPLKTIYRKLPRQQKQALLAYLIQIITN